MLGIGITAFLLLIGLIFSVGFSVGSVVDPGTLQDYGWIQPQDWSLARQGHVAQSVLNSSLLLLYGGREQVTSGLSSTALEVTDGNVYFYKIASGNSSGTFPMISFNANPGARFMAGSFLWGTGDSFFVVGGYQSEYLMDVWRADAKPFEGNSYGQWRPVHDSGSASTPDGRYGHIAELIQYGFESGVETGFAIVFGGIKSGGYVQNDAWVLKLASTGTIPECNSTKTFNGTSCSDYTSTLEDHEATWWELPLSNGSASPDERSFASAISIGSKTFEPDNSSCLYLMGGYNYVSSTYYDELWRLCSNGKIEGPQTNFTWTLLSPSASSDNFPSARYGQAMTKATAGRFFVFGGSSQYPDLYLSDSFEYDEQLGVWLKVNLVGSINSKRSHTISLLNGSIVTVGGMDSSGTLGALHVTNYSAPFCGGGYYMTLSSDSVPICRNCSSGYFSTYGSYECTECPAGTYNEDVASSNCTNCPYGTYNADTGSQNSSDCLSCPAGESTLQVASSSEEDCVGCDPGYYKSQSGAGVCLVCDAGTYSLGSAISCIHCVSGEYSLAGWSNCTLCPAGTFQSNSSSSSCTNCMKGYYSDKGASSCTACSAGTYNPSSRGATSSACSDCPVGTYCSYSGSHTPSDCPVGTASNMTGATSLQNCTSCPPGTYSDMEGSSVCTSCPSGTYQPLSGQTYCLECPENTYSETVGAANSTTCLSCPSGTTSSEGTASAEDCDECQAGSYANSPNEGPGCSDCQRGRYTSTSDEASMYNCTLCAPNTYNDVMGQTSCQACADGYYSFSGYSRCVPCNGTCPVGPNGHLCSGAGTCSYVLGVCDCNEGWGYLDCSQGYGDGPTGIVGFSLDSQAYYQSESDTFTLTLIRRVGLNGSATLRVEVVGGTATANSDYSSSGFPINVTFADGEDEVTISLPIIDDDETDEPCEYLNLTIVSDSGIGTVSYRGLEDLSDKATVYIMEDDFISVETNSTSYDTSSSGGMTPHKASVLLGVDNYTMTVDVTTPSDPASTTSLDLFFAVDFSYGNRKYVKRLRDNIDSSLLLLESSYSDLRLGLASFSDKPMSPYGTDGTDVEFQINLELTASSSDFYTALDDLYDSCLTSSSGDDKGSQLTALLQVAKQSSSVGWADDSYRVVVLVTSKDYHTPDDDCIDDGYCTDGSNNLDDDVSTTEDYPTVANVAAALMSKGIVPVFLTLSTHKDYYKVIGEATYDCYQWARLVNSASIYTKLRTALGTLEGYACPFVTDDEEGYALSLTADSSYQSLSAGDSVSYTLALNRQASTLDSTVSIYYWGFTTTIKISRHSDVCTQEPLEASGGLSCHEDDEARNGILQGFHSDEELDWVFAGSGTFSVQTVDGPYGISAGALNMTPCSGDVCSMMVAEYTFEPSYVNNIPLVLKAHTLASSSARSNSQYNYSVTMDITLQDGTLHSPAVSLLFNSSVKVWQYQYDVFYPNEKYVLEAKVYVTYAGLGSVLWTGVGLHGRSVEGCLCNDGYYVNALTTAARLCNPKPSCRYGEGTSACTRCTTGYACKAGRLEPCLGTDWAPGGSDECYSCRDGWLCQGGLTTPCERVKKVSNGTTCIDCPAGHWCRNGVAYACPKGKHSPGGSAADQCVACAPGTVANVTGMSICYDCPAGYTSNHGVSECVPCPPGEYTDEVGQFPCISCKPGTYSSGGETECYSCPVGTYSEEYASSQCITCPTGTSTASTGTNSSSLCI